MESKVQDPVLQLSYSEKMVLWIGQPVTPIPGFDHLHTDPLFLQLIQPLVVKDVEIAKAAAISEDVPPVDIVRAAYPCLSEYDAEVCWENLNANGFWRNLVAYLRLATRGVEGVAFKSQPVINRAYVKTRLSTLLHNSESTDETLKILNIMLRHDLIQGMESENAEADPGELTAGDRVLLEKFG